MVKIASSDALAILRKFDYAGDEHVPRHIEHLKITHPHEINTLVSFRFNNTPFFILVDDTADDDEQYIIDQIKTAQADIVGKLAVNPHDQLMTYGLPFKGKDVYVFELLSQKKRLDSYLAETYPEYSRSTWQKYIKAGYVTVDSDVTLSPKTDVSHKSHVAVSLPQANTYDSLTLPIVYQDDNCIVIDKPVGVLTHSKGALNDEFTVADFFRRYTTYNTDTNRPGIVHRLDRDTSGIMIGARNVETATLLQKQFADRRAKKTYYAVVDGTPNQTKAIIDLPIGRNPSTPSTFRVDASGKSAQTAYEVLASNGTHSLVELRPKTGRTHQLRVHMAYIGTPIHGDRVYGVEADRLYLHAHSLEVTIPTSNRQTFTSSVPPEFKELCQE
ncbi:MAG: RluA family pseudouridine synthase [Candidatus Saccharimonadales bacterium]